ncbi:hypothetical protein APASM_4975 [Actinosynnema pretiosum subsp. pretiosum]|nr:hypothetical protein APASM_4975 [Actinosynnema pretiosum subsp. pretiosum]
MWHRCPNAARGGVPMPSATFHDSLLDSEEAAAVQSAFDETVETDSE